jgi:hypothetical protein
MHRAKCATAHPNIHNGTPRTLARIQYHPARSAAALVPGPSTSICPSTNPPARPPARPLVSSCQSVCRPLAHSRPSIIYLSVCLSATAPARAAAAPVRWPRSRRGCAPAARPMLRSATVRPPWQGRALPHRQPHSAPRAAPPAAARWDRQTQKMHHVSCTPHPCRQCTDESLLQTHFIANA